jgi:hypothetical protein
MPPAGANVARLKFGWFTCQDWSINHWGAMAPLAQEDLDFLVHVGDYVYETVGASFQAGVAEPAHAALVLPDGTTLGSARYATTLADYRYLCRTYRGDARLRTLHQQWPLIAIWDDHEFSDDCWQDHQTYTNANLQQTARRRAASQAWVEYMPVDFGDVSFDSADAAYDNIRIYCDFQFGNLMHLIMIDQRLYRDDHVVSEAAIAQALGHDPINGNDFAGGTVFRPASGTGAIRCGQDPGARPPIVDSGPHADAMVEGQDVDVHGDVEGVGQRSHAQSGLDRPDGVGAATLQRRVRGRLRRLGRLSKPQGRAHGTPEGKQCSERHRNH